MCKKDIKGNPGIALNKVKQFDMFQPKDIK